MRKWLVLSVVLLVAPLPRGLAQRDDPSRGDAEVLEQVQNLQRRIDDSTVDLSTRERLALETAGLLDRAAQRNASADARRARWTEAINLLDKFREAHPSHNLSHQFQAQAAVYLWARARSWVDPARVALVDDRTRTKAAEDLDASVTRLRGIVTLQRDAVDVFAQNARFRLAQSLADHAEIDVTDASKARSRNEAALAALEPAPTVPSLQGFAMLLKARLLTRLGRHDEAWAEVERASRLQPPPAELDVLEARVSVLNAIGNYPEARKAIDASAAGANAYPALRIRVDLEDLRSKPPGPDRDAVESTLFRDLETVRKAKGPDSQLALLSVAATIREPSSGQAPIAWELLAEGALASGEPARAATLQAKGADRAEAMGDASRAADLRLRAGAAAFKAGDYPRSIALLTRVAENDQAGPLRPRAALLRALAAGRALAEKDPEASESVYRAALEYVVRNFPADAAANEASWLLGKLLRAGSDRAGARSQWSAIRPGSPRWLESRIELARMDLDEIDDLRIVNDPSAVARRVDEARKFLDDCRRQARDASEANPLLLARARLELAPGAGRPEAALATLETLLRSATRPREREEARGDRIVALGQLGRYVEAEQAAREVVSEAEFDVGVRLEALRRLDRSAAEAENDVKTRRIGFLMGMLVAPLAKQARGLSPTALAEVRLREVRAALFAGNDVAARRGVVGWSTSALVDRPDLLRDLADSYVRLDAYELAADVQRLRARNLASGSPSWLDARYGLALAYFRSGRAKDALSLIDATAILHPELGGGELRGKFIRLRQRIEPSP